MTQSSKRLKIASIVVLIFAGLSLINLTGELLWGELNNATLPEGAPANTLLITKIILAAVTVVCLLPQVYIGIKGLKVAAAPTASKGHIIWGIILLVLSAIGLISPALALLRQQDAWANLSELCSILVEVIVFFDYVMAARDVANGK